MVPTMVRAPLPVVVGPTAAGKSSLAFLLAERYGLSIVSADSRQIYRGFDIGTAKPTTEEQRRVPHAGIDCCAPTERYSAYQWAADATQWIHDLEAGDRSPIVVGGTGFYVRALVNPLHTTPISDDARRRELQGYLETLSDREIERWCLTLDPARAALGRTQRLRAIETAVLTGSRLSETFAASAKDRNATDRSARYLVVDPGMVLAARIESRVRQMVTNGWLDEVHTLLRHTPVHAPAWNACGYAMMRDVAQGSRRLEEAVERTVIETRQYAKRQRTWNRHQLPEHAVTRVDSTASDALDIACRWYETVVENRI